MVVQTLAYLILRDAIKKNVCLEHFGVAILEPRLAIDVKFFFFIVKQKYLLGRDRYTPCDHELPNKIFMN